LELIAESVRRYFRQLLGEKHRITDRDICVTQIKSTIHYD